MSLVVVDPGPYTLAVDGGRPSARSLGLPVGGAADRTALALANGLVGNPPEAVGLEIAFAGPTLRTDQFVAGVVLGAPFQLAISGRDSVEAGTTFTLQPGDTLRIGGTPTGVRGYLCVTGGFQFPEILGSRSSLAPLRAGIELKCPESRIASRRLPNPLPGEWTRDASTPVRLRCLPGPQREWFPNDEFFANEYVVDPASNRMGIRLVGPPIGKREGELASEPVAPGAVQITNDGRPVVLGVDGQTIGGYPKIAHVIRADLDRLGQLRPGVPVRFHMVTREEAEAATMAKSTWLTEWLTRLQVTRT